MMHSADCNSGTQLGAAEDALKFTYHGHGLGVQTLASLRMRICLNGLKQISAAIRFEAESKKNLSEEPTAKYDKLKKTHAAKKQVRGVAK